MNLRESLDQLLQEEIEKLESDEKDAKEDRKLLEKMDFDNAEYDVAIQSEYAPVIIMHTGTLQESVKMALSEFKSHYPNAKNYGIYARIKIGGRWQDVPEEFYEEKMTVAA